MVRSAQQAGVCPCCGQRMLRRHGVLLSPMLADLFDMIWRAGERGILCEVLAGVFYPGKSQKAAQRSIAVNVFHLNSRLQETDFEVRAGSGRYSQPYRITKRKVKGRQHGIGQAMDREAVRL